MESCRSPGRGQARLAGSHLLTRGDPDQRNDVGGESMIWTQVMSGNAEPDFRADFRAA